MPEITFGFTSLHPTLALTSDDYFYAPSADIPDMTNVDPDNIIGQAEELMDRIAPHIGDISKVPTFADVAGCDVGHSLARNAARLNATAEGGYTFEDIAIEVMDNDVDGFMVVYNAHVQAYARSLFVLADLTFGADSAGRSGYLNSEYTRLKRSLNGQIRGYNALLACAWGTAFLVSDLDATAPAPIVRQGKVPADFI